MKTKIVLYGTGVRGEQFFWKNLDKYEIEYCIDRNSGRMFHGIPVYSFEDKKEELIESFIVIAAIDDIYKEMAQMLTNCGLVEGSNFIWDEYFDRDIAVLYGNCHMNAVADYLQKNPVFCKKYCVLHWEVWREPLPDAVMQNCKLIICQDIRKENSLGVPSADEMEAKVDGGGQLPENTHTKLIRFFIHFSICCQT